MNEYIASHFILPFLLGERGRRSNKKCPFSWDTVGELILSAFPQCPSFLKTSHGAGVVRTPILWMESHSKRVWMPLPKTHRCSESWASRFPWQKGPSLSITSPSSLRRLKKQSPLEIYFQPQISDLLQMSGTEMVEYLVDSSQLPDRLKTLTLWSPLLPFLHVPPIGEP